MPDSQIHCPLCSSAEVSFHLRCRDHLVSNEAFDLFRCSSCELVFTQAPPGPAEIGRYYQSPDYISHSDTKHGLTARLYHLARRLMLSAKRKSIQKNTGRNKGRLLDFGSGTGYFIRHMADHGWEAQGIEIDQGAREYAKRWTGLPVDVPEKLASFLENQFDVITLWHVFEHLHDFKEMLARFHRILKADGKLILALPNYTSFDAQHYREFWAAYDVPRHLWHFSPVALARCLDAAHFQLKAMAPLPFDAFYVSMLSEKYQDHRLFPLRGLLNGTASWFITQKEPERGSSLVYVAGKS